VKSMFELRFEKEVIYSISERECCVQCRAELFQEFYKNGSIYYEDLCDALYSLAIGEQSGSLYITPAGKPYISYVQKGIEDTELFPVQDLPGFTGDLHPQLCFFMRHFSDSKKCCRYRNVTVDIGNTM